MKAIPDKRYPGTPRINAEIGRDYCNDLYEIERTLTPNGKKDTSTAELNMILIKPVFSLISLMHSCMRSAILNG